MTPKQHFASAIDAAFKRLEHTPKPWIQQALDQGRKVPNWMRERDLTEREFLDALVAWEKAFPETKP